MNFLDLIFPKHCVSCGKLGRYVCDGCSSIIRIIKPNEAICPVCEKPAMTGKTHPKCQTRYSPDGLTSFFRYDGVVKKAIKAIKYRFVSDLAGEFVSLIPNSLSFPLTMNHQQSTIIVPIPLHPSRARERGFNQAEVLGARLAERLHIPMQTDSLRRTRKTTPQVEMKDKEERVNNMKDVFAINQSTIQQYNNVTIILFDDVFTTGATMRSAANTLKRAGIKRVWGLTMAR